MNTSQSRIARVSRPVRLLLVLVAAFVAGGVGAATVAGASASAPDGRPVIVDVRGDKANGFDIEHADGTTLHPPTDSESMAECSEYDSRVDRVRCRAQVNTWYRDLGDLQRSLAWVRAHG